MDKEKKTPPFGQKQGKLGDTKQWNGKTYHFCPANHKHSHWHAHKVEDCNTFKKMNKNQSDKSVSSDPSGITNQVTVDTTKLRKGMAAVFPSGDFDTDDLVEALATTMTGVKGLLLLWFLFVHFVICTFYYHYHRMYGLITNWQ